MSGINDSDQNQVLVPTVRMFFLIVVLIVLFGSGLFLLPALVQPRWPWAITPFNAAFLGGVYLTELAMVVLLMGINRWSPARPAISPCFSFHPEWTLKRLQQPSNTPHYWVNLLVPEYLTPLRRELHHRQKYHHHQPSPKFQFTQLARSLLLRWKRY